MDRPNILVIMCDQLKATASHLYGNTFCETPNLARLADEGVLFRNAFTPHPLCVPARVALWTSQYPHSSGARRNETWMSDRNTHAFQLWAEQGYHLGLIGKNHCFERKEDLSLFETWCEISHGGIPRGAATRGMDWFRPLEDIHAAHAIRRDLPHSNPRFAWGIGDHPLEDHSTGLIVGQAERYLERHRDEPFALWVSFPDPHEPYEAPRQYAEMFPRDRIVLPPSREGEFADAPQRNQVLYRMLGMEDDSEEDIYGYLSAYYGNVRFLDDGVGQILDALDRLALRENTIVVFCADHGDFSGEHNMNCKGGVFYDALTRIPLLVSWPGQIAHGQVDESMANLIDVVPTLLQLQGVPVPECMHGQALPTVTDAQPRDATFSEYGAGGAVFTMDDLRRLPESNGRSALIRSLQWREAEGRRKMVRTREWKYVHDPMGDKDELYDMQQDPWELTNVIDDSSLRDVLMDLRLRLADWSILTEDSPPVPLPDPERYQIAAR